MDHKQHKKQTRKVIRWVALALVVALLAVMPLIASRSAKADGPQASILTAKAEIRDITAQLIGGGQLRSDATENITIPAQVKLEKYLVSNGDTIKKGDPIARVDKVSVMVALQEVQETLDYLSRQISSVSNDTEPDQVKARSGGVVKILYAEPGDNVREVMLEHGALAVLSLDGRMALDIPKQAGFSYGDTVTVTLTDGTELEGRVESALEDTMTVSVEDDNYAVGTAAVVTEKDGTGLGSGELYIHSPWNATAYTGTVTAVNVTENTKVSSGKVLFRLETEGHSAQFQILTQQRRDYEALMTELFAMYDSGVITAPCDGLITGVDEEGAFLLSDTEAGHTWRLQLASSSSASESEGGETPPPEGGETPPPEGGETPPPEGGEGGGETGCDCPDPESGHEPDCPEYEEVPVPSSNVFLVEAVSEAGVTLKYISGDNPHKPASFSGTTYPDGTPIAVGDLVMLSPDNTITKIGSAAPQSPGMGQMPGMDFSALIGGMHGFGGLGGMGGFGGSANVQAFEPYSLDTLTIATITSQEHMTLEITVDEQDISRLQTGMAATITVEAMPGQTFPATVTSIGNTGTNLGGSSKFTAKLTLDKSSDMLPGMNASAFLDLDTASSVLSVPVAAVTDTGANVFLHTGYDEKKDILSNPVAVTTGISDGEYVQILSGLSEGDAVFYAYYDTAEENHIPDRGLGF